MDTDDDFFSRADAVIHLANSQLSNVPMATVSASTLYAASRFNASLSAAGFQSGEDMKARKDETVDYFMKQYRAMLEDNLNDYILNFAKYKKGGGL